MSHEPTEPELNAAFAAWHDPDKGTMGDALTAANALRDVRLHGELEALAELLNGQIRELEWAAMKNAEHIEAAEARAEAAERALADARRAALEEAVQRLQDPTWFGASAVNAIRALASASPQSPQSPAEE